MPSNLLTTAGHLRLTLRPLLSQDILQRLLDFFVHLASAEHDYVLDGLPMGDKARFEAP